MNVEVLVKEKEVEFKVGDLFEYVPSRLFGMLIKTNFLNTSGYVIKFPNGQTLGYNEDSISKIKEYLNNEVKKGDVIHYSQDEYKLQLVKI